MSSGLLVYPPRMRGGAEEAVLGKIAFWHTIGITYRFLVLNFGAFLRLAGLWMLLQIAVIGWSMTIVPAAWPLNHVAMGAFVLLEIAGPIAFAVAWHRAVLVRGESGFLTALRFGWRELRYLGNDVLIAVVLVSPAIAAALLVYFGMVEPSLEALREPKPLTIALGLGVLLALITVLRLLLAFPAIALDEPGEVLDLSWRWSRRNTLRIALGFLLVNLPWAALGALRASPPIAATLHGPNLAWDAIAVLLQYLAIAATAGFLSYAYVQLAVSAPEAEPQPESRRESRQFAH